MPKTLTKESQQEFEWLLTRYPKKRAALLPLLRIIERDFGAIDHDGMKLAAELIGCSPADVLAVVTFYTHYQRETDGRHVIWVCNTLPCALRGARKMTTAIETKLGIGCGQTTEDGRFSLKKAECLASCDTAPCFQIGEEHYENVTEDQIDKILANHK
ncbi:MAG: NADH-quinone oxidoreductase subunit NuoE family protein [Planctomycetota bacterium]|jgi:NADH-quinone oxidoreductase subunit E